MHTHTPVSTAPQDCFSAMMDQAAGLLHGISNNIIFACMKIVSMDFSTGHSKLDISKIRHACGNVKRMTMMRRGLPGQQLLQRRHPQCPYLGSRPGGCLHQDSQRRPEPQQVGASRGPWRPERRPASQISTEPLANPGTCTRCGGIDAMRVYCLATAAAAGAT